jgi:hypothetical protein
MPIPISTEKVARAVVKALVQGGFLANTAQANKLYAVPANATDTDIDTIVAGLAFGASIPTSADYTSTTDLNMWIDSDDLPITLHQAFFRVCRAGSTAANLSKSTEIFSIQRIGGLSGLVPDVVATIGPTKTVTGGFAANDYYGASLNIGTYRDVPATVYYYGTIAGGATALPGNVAGLRVQSTKLMELHLNLGLNIRSTSSSDVRAGFWGIGSPGGSFFLGEAPATTFVTSLLFRQTADHTLGAYNGDYEFNLNNSTSIYKYIFLSSNETTYKANGLVVNGMPTLPGRRPYDYGTSGPNDGPTFSVFGSEDSLSGTGDNVGLFRAPQAAGYTNHILRVLGDSSVQLPLLRVLERRRVYPCGTFARRRPVLRHRLECRGS